MRIRGCDLHARQQVLAMLDTTKGEVVNVRSDAGLSEQGDTNQRRLEIIGLGTRRFCTKRAGDRPIPPPNPVVHRKSALAAAE